MKDGYTLMDVEKWFNVVRDTSNDKIKAVYKMGEKPPSE